MTPQELKASILQLAIQGKLVPQISEEGTGEELFLQIQEEKQLLIKAGTIKKEKPLPKITEDEIVFDIPENWKWIRLSDVGQLKNGYSFKSTEYTSTGIQVVRISDLGEDAILSNDAVYYPLKDDLSPYIIENNSFLICMTGSIGKLAWVRDRVLRYLNQRVGMFVPSSICCSAYLWYFLHAAHVINGWIRAKTSTNGNIKTSDITELVVPFPPLAEQERIVAKLEQILPQIDRYEAAWNKLEDFNKRFPVDMQKSILQMAIQGKLVEQRPEEGTGEELYQQIQAEKQRLIKAGTIKKEKPLPEIAEDEIPFDIPESWKWVQWGDLSQSIQYGYNAPAQEKGRIKMVRISDIQDGKVLWDTVPYCDIKEDEIPTYLLGENDILFARTGGTVGKSYLVKEVPEEAIYAGYLIRTQYSSLLCPEYMKYFMESQLYWDQLRNGTIATAQPNCNGKTLSKMILPLPPLAEQKRIVAKLEEILPLCERLK